MDFQPNFPGTLHSFSTHATRMLDVAGTAVFAISGALEAAKKRQNILTFFFFAVITGVGGGTIRDLFIGAPVAWLHNSTTALTCLLAALAVWFTPSRLWPERAVDWFDGVGIAAYGVFGTAKATAYGIPPLPALLMGVVSACLGGIFRDVLAGVPSIVIRRELYVTAVALASGLYVLLTQLGQPPIITVSISIAAGFILRALAITHGVGLPVYKR
ncbi:trimeric intracellular cation channel family protein [Neokomagataea tanensis]|uniref:Trimeric intracellular cation channel family protein n=2 Tax=Neokomagataea TaxID=1223423 RepID=A0A4Y6VBU2_9PROT|nr:trimeric intracellular cation channel family protein [Neokomagataea tanensis]